MTQSFPDVGVVVIGRNEGARLVACLKALADQKAAVIYVDSGSTDGSVVEAQRLGADCISLDMSVPFTAARARNAGLALLQKRSDIRFIQFIDGDCVMNEDWLQTAHEFLKNNPKAAVVSGRLRERFPTSTIYNQLCDDEWNTPIGRVRSCGGITMMRREAVEAVQGFRPNMIAGEEPELCVRLRSLGWEIWRIDAEMALHDAAMTRFGQYWKRARRGGHAYAEGAALHGAPPERHGVAGRRRAVLWGLVLPICVLFFSLFFWPWGVCLALVYPLQVLRLALCDNTTQHAWRRAVLLTLGKFAEAQGVLEYYINRWRGTDGRLIEYK